MLRESEREKKISPYQDSPGFVFGISYDGLQFAHSLRRDVLYTAKVFVERWEAECRQSFVQDFKCASQRNKKKYKKKGGKLSQHCWNDDASHKNYISMRFCFVFVLQASLGHQVLNEKFVSNQKRQDSRMIKNRENKKDE